MSSHLPDPHLDASARTSAAARPRFGLAVLAIVLAFSLASIFCVNPYEYGVGDTSITIPFTKAVGHPELYPHDFLLQQRPFYYTYLWEFVGEAHRILGVPLSILFFSIYSLAIYFTFLGVYSIAMQLFRRRDAAVLSMVFLLFSKPTLAGVNTVEFFLSTRQVALPLLLFALYFFLDGKLLRSFALAGVAYLVHPLTTHFALGMMLFAGVFQYRGARLRKLGLGFLAFLAIASPLLLWKFTRTPQSMHLLGIDPGWLEALRLRSWHHMFPLSWGWGHTLMAALTCVLFGIGWMNRGREENDRHRAVLYFAAAIVVMYFAGMLFTDILPIGVFVELQLGRSFQFMEYFAMIYVANFVCRSVEESWRMRDLAWAAAVAATMFVGTYLWLRGLTLLLPIAIVIAILRFTGRRPLRERTFVGLLVALLCVESAAFELREMAKNHEASMSLAVGQDDPWLEVQAWARSHTDLQDSFIVPPLEDGEFRVEGERTVYADWEDGGLMNGNPAFGREWVRRMHLLGLDDPTTFEDDFLELPNANVVRIAKEMRIPAHRVFLVMPKRAKPRSFPVRFRNSNFVVYEVPEGVRALLRQSVIVKAESAATSR